MTDSDSRIPVCFVPSGAEAAWLVEGERPVAAAGLVARFALGASPFGHPGGCACCVPRTPVAEALGRLFLDHIRGQSAFFAEVVVLASPAGQQAVRAALQQDQVCAGRFRLAEQ